MASKLMHRGPYEAEDPLEALLLEAFTCLQSQLKPPFQLTVHSPQEYSRLTQALLYGILTQPHSGQTHVTHLKAIVTDGYATLVKLLIRLVNESFTKLLEQTRIQIIWIFRQMVELDASDADNLCLSLLRRIVGGDLSQGNVWLALELLHVLQSNWAWVTSNPGLVTGALFTYLRLLPDHWRSKSPLSNVLKKNEIEFCVRVLRERFHECLAIGRDLVRLLQDVVCIPDFELIWKDLLSNPGAFRVSGFSDVSQLYFSRTPSRYLISRITPEMENQIRFILTHVRWGNQRRYQVWFAKKFLSTPESETLICDLIRFICCVHHPPNDILQSDVIQRWAIVGWLLKCCRSNYVEANAKLALFYDWLFFSIKVDNIMNIEPAILLMVHSIPKYIDITQSLLEFLFLLMDHYDTNRKELIRQGISASFEILVGKGVVRSLEALSSCNLIAPSLREKLITCFLVPRCKVDCNSAGGVMKTAAAISVATGPVDLRKAPTIRGQISAPLACQEGNQSLVGQFLANDLGGDGVVPQKRRRIDVSNKTWVNGVLEALNQSHEMAVGMLEKILMSFLGVSDQTLDNMTGENMIFEVLQDSSSETAMKLAIQIADVFKAGGHDMFMPLSHAPDVLEGDEIMSMTSVVLRMYILLRHPILREILSFWYKNGFAVGPRLLCYACRLVDELEQISMSDHAIDHSQLSQKLKDRMGSLNEQEVSLAVTVEGVGELAEKKKDVINHGKNGLLRKSMLKWHAERYSLFVGARESSSTDIQHSKKMDVKQFCIMVEDAFAAYKEFLMFNSTTVPMHQTNNFSQNKMLPAKTSDGFLPKAVKYADQNPAAAFLEDLRTCCLWNVSRLQQVLRSIFCYLSDLSVGREGVIQLLVCFLVPAELLKFEIKLSLKDFSVFGEDPQTICSLVKSSLDWDFMEQQTFWRLLISELQASVIPLAMTLLTFCAEVLDPLVHAGAVAGLLMFLRSQCPSVELVNAILCLPERFEKFAASVIASWSMLNSSALFMCLKAWTECHVNNIQRRIDRPENNTLCIEKVNGAAIIAFINFLGKQDSNLNIGSKNLRIADTLEIRSCLLELADNVGFREMAITKNKMHKEVET